MKKFGDRKDGVRIRDLNGMNYINYQLKKKRCQSEVYINYSMDITKLVKYVEKINKKSDVHITYFHIFATALAKVIYNRPYLNRFIVNGHFYDRNEVSISYVAKTSFDDDSKELMQVLKIEEDDNLFTISDRISNRVKKTRNSKSSSTDDLVDKIGKMPKVLRNIIVGIFKFLDRHDLLPVSMTREIVYYSTILMSNIGSIGCKEAIYHNLTDFGTNSGLVTIGKIYKKEVINDDGSKKIGDFCDFGITLDERIADGFYMIKAVQLLEYILNNPELLEGDCNDKIEIK